MEGQFYVYHTSKVMFRNRVQNSFRLMHHLVAHAQTHQLKTSLQAAAMGNKTLVISYLNKAYVEENGMLDLFLRSLKEGEDTAFLITHLFLITVDQTAFDRCKMHRLHCYRLVSEGLNFSKEQLFMSDGYINLVWQKVVVLGEVLKHGYNFIFTVG